VVRVDSRARKNDIVRGRRLSRVILVIDAERQDIMRLKAKCVVRRGTEQLM
jgi:hypothetical protein